MKSDADSAEVVETSPSTPITQEVEVKKVVSKEEKKDDKTFEVTVKGNLSDIVTDKLDTSYVYITKIKPGPLESTAMKAGMYITKVNGATSGLEAELAKLSEATLTVRHPTLFKVSCDKLQDDNSLHLSITYNEDVGTSLVVKEVLPGPIKNWNTANPGKAVSGTDRLIEVNGITGSAKSMLDAMKKGKHMEITVSRCG